MRAGLVAVLLALTLPVAAQAGDDPVAADAAVTSSRVDFTRPGVQQLPVRCKPGDVEYFAGRTLGEVFGAAWPAPPVADHATPARVVDRVAPAWPKGLGQDGAVAVVAALVGPDGRALDARALCASAPAISKPAVRATLRSTFEPARFDGVPTTSVAVRIIRFGVKDPPSTPVPDRPGRDPAR